MKRVYNAASKDARYCLVFGKVSGGLSTAAYTSGHYDAGTALLAVNFSAYAVAGAKHYLDTHPHALEKLAKTVNVMKVQESEALVELMPLEGEPMLVLPEHIPQAL